MSDDELRDNFGREIERAFPDEPAATAGTRAAVRRRAQTRRRARIVSGVAVLLVVAIAGVAIATRDDSVKVSTNQPPTTQPSCAPTDSHSFVWRGVRYTLTEPVLNGTPVLRLGKTCGGRPIWRITGYKERAALAVGIGPSPHVYTAKLSTPYTGVDVFDLGDKPDGDVTRIDLHRVGRLEVPIVQDGASIRKLIAVLRNGRGDSGAVASETTNVPPAIVTLHRSDGAMVEFALDPDSRTGLLDLGGRAWSDVGNRLQAAGRFAIGAERDGAGIAVVHGSETWLYDDEGRQISLLPTPSALPGYNGPAADGSNATALAVKHVGTRYVLERTMPVASPRPPNVPADCTRFVTAGDYTAALCASRHRAVLLGPSGVIGTIDEDPTNMHKGFWNPLPNASGRALFSHYRPCHTSRMMMLDERRNEPQLFGGGTAVGWTRHGEAIIAYEAQCTRRTPRVDLYDPNTNSSRIIIDNLPDLNLPTLKNTPDPVERGTVYRWYWPGGD